MRVDEGEERVATCPRWRRALLYPVVAGLEAVDVLLDRVPSYERDAENLPRRWRPRGDWGCRTLLSDWSFRLDERYGVGYWKPVSAVDLADEDDGYRAKFRRRDGDPGAHP